MQSHNGICHVTLSFRQWILFREVEKYPAIIPSPGRITPTISIRH